MITIKVRKPVNLQDCVKYEIYCNEIFMAVIEGPIALMCAGAIAKKLKNNDTDWSKPDAVLEEFGEK